MGFHRGPKIVTNGLVAHYDAASYRSYPGSGTTWYDLSGNNNHGTIVNSPTFSNGVVTFNGTNETISIPDPIQQSNLSQVWTIQSWVNPADTTSQCLIGNLNKGVFIQYSSTNGLLYLNDGANDYYIYGGPLTNLGWVMVTFKFDNSDATQEIWRNLTDVSASAINLTSTPSGIESTLYIGNRSDLTYPMDGDLATLKIYNRLLTDAEITQNFNAQRNRFGI